MKKIFTLILTLSLFLALCACGATTVEPTPAAQDPSASTASSALVGGWTLADPICGNALPEDAQSAFDKALDGFVGNNLEPVVLLGTQTVAGTNFSILCKSTLVTATPVISLQVVTVYADLQGNAEIRNIADFNLADYTAGEGSTASDSKAGGWAVSNDLQSAILPEVVATAFEKAADGLLGVDYVPAAYLASQVVSGSNYAFLCKASPVAPDADSSLCVAVVYADLNGNASFTSFCTLELADFNV